MSAPKIVFSRRLRQTPFEQRALEQGAKAFTVYNHMPLSSVYESPEEDYAHLCEHVQVWDVACERQVEVVGKDALALVELVTPRDISKCAIGQCFYAPVCDENGGVVNDPIIIRLAEDRFWVSIADSDVLLWMKGIAYGRAMDVSVFEPDVSPLAVQGPKSFDLMADLVGEHIRDIRFFWFIETEIAGTEVILARSGWSGQGGFEIYLQDSSRGLDLWDAVWRAGEKYNIRAGCPNLIERLETGLLSYGSDMTLDNNPLECGLDRFFKLGKPAEYMCREALDTIAAQGVARKVVNLKVMGDKLTAPRSTWNVKNETGEVVGILTSLAYSPKYEANLCFATIDAAYGNQGADFDS
ncbi:MAG: dimethylsulfoniopropionate demethylase [Gammaproteobacteria bacterium]|nr:dimethylsulfoniopropionate demethylase [Gammaproteobacteria bacterium]